MSTRVPFPLPQRSLLFALLFVALPLRAADIRVDGSYRLRFDDQTDLTLDDAGTRLGQRGFLEHRLRLTPKIIEQEGPLGLEIQASFDALSGLVAGDVAPPFQGLGFRGRSERSGLKASGFDFRHLFVQLRVPAGVFELGQMPSHWGMGMLTNGGTGEHEQDFGDERFGDIVERALFATRPFGFLGPRSPFFQRLALALGGDLVYRDRYADLVVGNGGGGLSFADTAFQLVSALFWDPSEATRAGVYVVRRVQSYRGNGGDLHTWVFDGHLRTVLAPDRLDGTLSFEAEGAQVYGGTSHAPTLGAPGTTRISQQGLAARATLATGRLEAEVEGGYASGDANPFDDQGTAFMMSRDFKVGLVLFDEVLLFQTQNAAARLASPQLVGRPPPGVDLIPTEGAVTNAIYLKPTLRYRPGVLSGRLRLIGSVLFARAPEPVVDAYQALAGSSQRNAFGAPAARSYGTEVDVAATWKAKLADPFGLELGAQAGVLFPGDVFNHADGTRMQKASAFKLRATLVF